MADIRKEEAALRLEPCQGDSELREKETKLEELGSRAKSTHKIPQDLQRKRQRLMSEAILKGSSDTGPIGEAIGYREKGRWIPNGYEEGRAISDPAFSS